MQIEAANYYALPRIEAEDIEPPPCDQTKLKALVAQTLNTIFAETHSPPRAILARAFVGDPVAEEPPSTLIASFPLLDPDHPAELHINLEAVVGNAIEMHQNHEERVADPRARKALEEIADVLDAQVRKIRKVLQSESSNEA